MERGAIRSKVPLSSEEISAYLPDFAIERCSESISLQPLQQKMQEDINNGLRLGWLIDPQNRPVELYCTDRSIQILQDLQVLDREDVLSGFSRNLAILWEK